jgi:hypothetical protein
MDMDIMWICIWMWMNNGYVSGHDMDMNMIMSEHVHRNCYAHDVAMDMIRTWICHAYGNGCGLDPVAFVCNFSMFLLFCTVVLGVVFTRFSYIFCVL